MGGKLTLVPTPIDDENPLEGEAKKILLSAFNLRPERSLFAVEELAQGRRRWLRFGLPREAVDDLIPFNEHTAREEGPRLLSELQRDCDVYLMSDGGLPAFCDPGAELIGLCHQNHLPVGATPFPNAVALAWALSGFSMGRFVFQGFLPAKKEARDRALIEVALEPRAQIIMDTPYRLEKTLEELYRAHKAHGRLAFLALDLGSSQEELLRAPLAQLRKRSKGKKQRREFVLVLGPSYPCPYPL